MSLHMQGIGPGRYMAVCGNGGYQDYQVMEFEIPDTPENSEIPASMYYMKHIDVRLIIGSLGSLLQAIYPAEIFDPDRVVKVKMAPRSTTEQEVSK